MSFQSWLPKFSWNIIRHQCSGMLKALCPFYHPGREFHGNDWFGYILIIVLLRMLVLVCCIHRFLPFNAQSFLRIQMKINYHKTIAFSLWTLNNQIYGKHPRSSSSLRFHFDSLLTYSNIYNITTFNTKKKTSISFKFPSKQTSSKQVRKLFILTKTWTSIGTVISSNT